MVNDIVIRASSLSGYSDCARRSAAKMFKRDIEAAGYKLAEGKSNIGASMGTAMHDVMAYTLNSKIASGSLGDDDAALDVGIESLHKKIKEEPVHFDKMTPDMNSAEKQVRRKTRTFRNAAENIEAFSVELHLEAKIRPGYLLSGHVDWIEKDGFADLKSGKFESYNAPQYGAYSMLSRSNGYNIIHINELLIQTVELNRPQPDAKRVHYDMSQSEQDAEMVIDYIIKDHNEFLKTGDKRVFRPNPSSMLCNEKYCTAWATNFCRSHKGAK